MKVNLNLNVAVVVVVVVVVIAGGSRVEVVDDALSPTWICRDVEHAPVALD